MDNLLAPKPQIKETIRIIKQQEKEYKFIGSMTLYPGHTLFKYNEETNTIEPAIVKKEVFIGIDKKPHKKMSVQFEANCIYIGALNEKNACKKINKVIKLLTKY